MRDVIRLGAAGLALLAAVGCQTAERQYEAQKAVLDAVDAGLTFWGAFRNAADAEATTGWKVQETHIASVWATWLARHTDGQGRLVSTVTETVPATQPGGVTTTKTVTVPMPVEQLQKALEIRDSMRADLTLRQTKWREVLGKSDAVQADLKTLVAGLKAKNVEWRKVDQQAADLLDSVLKAAIGAGAGFGVGAAAL